MRTNAILFDLDDTLIDTRNRHFHLVNDFLNMHEKEMTIEDYLNIRKKKGWSNLQIVEILYSLNASEFSTFWKRNIESLEYFKYDVEIVNTKLLYEVKTKQAINFILLSLRSSIKLAEEQFKQYSFQGLFEQYHFLHHADINPKIEKLKMYKKLYQQIIFVSDSQEDCKAAELANVAFVGVQSGIYNVCCENLFEDVNSFLTKKNENDY